jgi:hypothetical protein
MATSIFFNGRLISVPGSYSQIDASGLESVGLGASGIIGVIGTAEGGKPASAMTEPNEFLRLTKPEKGKQLFRSGDLREVADMLFAPSKDPDILAGAQEVVAMKVNPATQSAATLINSYGDSIALSSIDYGAFTGQINVSIDDGTTQGKLITITFEDVVEAGDDIGGNVFCKLKYVKPTNGWDTMTSEVESSGAIVAKATRAQLGLDGDITSQLSSDTLVDIVSASAADVGLSAIVYGLTAGGAAQIETLVLNGTTAVNGALTFSKVLGIRIIGTTVGTVTLTKHTGGATVLTVAAGANATKGLGKFASGYVANLPVTAVSSGASTKRLLLIGLSTSGAVQVEKLTLTGTTPVVGAANFSELQYLAMGEVEAAQTITLSANAGRTSIAVQSTLQKCADYYNARYASSAGFVFTLVTGKTSFSPQNLDVTTGAQGPVSCLSPAEPSYYADLWTCIDWINTHSQYVSAAKASGAKGGAPANTTTPTFLAGGGEGTTLFSHWQNALNLLKKVRVNSIVVLTGDPAVHAALDAHCAYMCGIGRNERDGFVGLLNAGLTDVATKTEAKSQAVDLNTRHIRAFPQSIERYNTAGEREDFLPYFTAAIAAGMQAGAPPGTSLTFKYANVLALRQDSSWNPVDDAEEMIQGGLCFLENIEGVGRRFVRNVTTHLSSDNLAFIEGSVNAAVNFACFNFRTNMEMAVGKRGFAGTINAAKGVALNALGLLVDSIVLVAWRSLGIELAVDVLDVEVEIAPIIPVNFVKNTIHLVTIRQTT